MAINSVPSHEATVDVLVKDVDRELLKQQIRSLYAVGAELKDPARRADLEGVHKLLCYMVRVSVDAPVLTPACTPKPKGKPKGYVKKKRAHAKHLQQYEVNRARDLFAAGHSIKDIATAIDRRVLVVQRIINGVSYRAITYFPSPHCHLIKTTVQDELVEKGCWWFSNNAAFTRMRTRVLAYNNEMAGRKD